MHHKLQIQNESSSRSSKQKYEGLHIDYSRIQKQVSLNYDSIPVLFPFEPYDCQREFMQSVIKSLNNNQNSLIQCPTGTGKTLALLCSTLAWLHQKQTQKQGNNFKIIYASRTHSQLKQIIKQLKKTVYCPSLVIASSRDYSCCNNQLKILEGKVKQLQCRKRIGKVQGKGCIYFKDDIVMNKIHGHIKHKIMDIEQLVDYGKSNCFCPFYYSRKVKQNCDMILMPYNYLFDQQVRQNYGIQFKNCIIILDEGHNIVSISQEGFSTAISTKTLISAIQQISHFKQSLLYKPSILKSKGKQSQMISRQYHSTIQIVQQYLQPIVNLQTYLKQNYFTLFEGRTDNVDDGCLITIPNLMQHIHKATSKGNWKFDFDDSIIQYELLGGMIFADMLYMSASAIQNWRTFIQKLVTIRKKSTQIQDKFAVALLMDGQNLKIDLLCLDASKVFQQLKKDQPYNFILTSGTLSPLNLWECELGLKFPAPLALPNIIQDDQLIAYTINKGVNGSFFDFNYSQRNNEFMFKDLAFTILAMIKTLPNGVVILFSSYSLLDNFRKNAGASTMSNLWREKDLFFENKDSTNFKKDLEQYIQKSKTTKGSIFFAVMRGKLSQGLDLDSDKCRAVILVGVPYLPTKTKKVQAKKSFLDSRLGQKGILNGNQWYMAQTIRSINQAVGRVIRNNKDYGGVFLIDNRFLKKQINDHIAQWVRTRIIHNKSISDILIQVKKFFVAKAEKMNKQFMKIQPKIQQQVINKNRISSNSILSEQLKGIRLTKPRNNSSISISSEQYYSTDNTLNQKKISQTNSLIQILKQNTRNSVQNQSQKLDNTVIVPMRKSEFSLQRDIFTKPITIGPKPLFKKPIQPKPQSKVVIVNQQNQQDDNLCGICTTKQILIPNKVCTHKFCLSCWKTWLETNLCCPNCRTRVRQAYLILPSIGI